MFIERWIKKPSRQRIKASEACLLKIGSLIYDKMNELLGDCHPTFDSFNNHLLVPLI